MTPDQPGPADPLAPAPETGSKAATNGAAGAEGATPPSRRLILLRHAKSAWPDGVSDPERPLATRGVADATAAGPILAGLAPLTADDVVLCSPARRTRQTWRLVGQALPDLPPTRFEPAIYGAEVDDLLDLIRSVPDAVATVVVVGHEPTMSQTAAALAGPGSDRADLARLNAKYPTSGMAVFTLGPDVGWSGLDVRKATLERFVVPRG